MAGWRDKAKCKDEDAELFFPVGTSGPAAKQIERAKSVCGSCSVREICGEHAAEFGVWGGTSEDDRRSSRQRARR